MGSLAETLVVINAMKSDLVVKDYAIAGAMAVLFWSEPVPTFDLDVLVFMPESPAPLVSRSPLYEWAERHGHTVRAEHIEIRGVPVQFIPSPSALADEAITSAAAIDYEGMAVRVVRPEYLIALYLEPGARTAKRRERAAALLELPSLDRGRVDEILQRYGLSF
jgi:hypothetical protein